MFEMADTKVLSVGLAQIWLCLPNERMVYLTPDACRLTDVLC